MDWLRSAIGWLEGESSWSLQVLNSVLRRLEKSPAEGWPKRYRSGLSSLTTYVFEEKIRLKRIRSNDFVHKHTLTTWRSEMRERDRLSHYNRQANTTKG